MTSIITDQLGLAIRRWQVATKKHVMAFSYMLIWVYDWSIFYSKPAQWKFGMPENKALFGNQTNQTASEIRADCNRHRLLGQFRSPKPWQIEHPKPSRHFWKLSELVSNNIVLSWWLHEFAVNSKLPNSEGISRVLRTSEALFILTTNPLYHAKSDGNGWLAKHEFWGPTNHHCQKEKIGPSLLLPPRIRQGNIWQGECNPNKATVGPPLQFVLKKKNNKATVRCLWHFTARWQCSLHHVAVCNPKHTG